MALLMRTRAFALSFGGVGVLLAGASSVAPAIAAGSDDTSLTFYGVTLYGTVDIGVAYLSHGAPLSSDYGPGLPFLVQKFSNKSITSIAPNGLSQSKLGLSGVEPLMDGFSAVFKLETGFQPTSGKLTDGPASLVANNGKALDKQGTSGDSSRAGQPFQGAAYGGLSSKTYGTLTFGRQNGLMADDLNKYDPQLQSQAFSPIGYSGVAGGLGDTEDKALDQSLKYVFAYGPGRLAVLHQFGSAGSLPGGATEVDIGGDYAGLSVDALYGTVDGAVAASPLNATQAAAAPGTLAATISDNTTFSFQAKYVYGPAKFYAGYEHIKYENPSHPLDNGTVTIGGYVLSNINNSAYNKHRILQVSWFGVRYAVTPRLDVVGAYYRYDQGSYNKQHCSNNSASSCSGTLNDISAVADYRLSKRFDVYLGVNYSKVADGLSAGYLNSSAIAPMTGLRFNF